MGKWHWLGLGTCTGRDFCILENLITKPVFSGIQRDSLTFEKPVPPDKGATEFKLVEGGLLRLKRFY